MSSFFSNGFAVMVNNSKRKKAAKNKDNEKDSGKKDAQKSSEGKDKKKDDGEWEMLTDAYGRLYWQHSVTGEWGYIYGGGGGLVAPAAAVTPSPIVYPGGAAFFTPSPPPVATVNPPHMMYPGGAAVFPPSPVYPVVPAKKKGEGKKKKEEGEKKEESKGTGWWETKYNDEGRRFWEHTGSKKKVYKDPYY